MKFRIAYLMHQFPPEVGAGSARAWEMARRWTDRGADVTVMTGFPSRALPGQEHGTLAPEYRGKFLLEEKTAGIRVLRSWLYSSPAGGFRTTILNNLSFMATSAMHAIARLGRQDVFIASSPPFFLHITGAVVQTVRRVPLVLEVRDLWPDYLVGMGLLREGQLFTRFLFAMEKWLLSRAVHTVVVTESFKRRIAEKGVPEERITVIPNGVDASFYHPVSAPPPIPAVERRGGEFIIGYLGTFGAGQALVSVVEAAAIVAREAPAIRIVLVGDGPNGKAVRARAAELGLSNLEILPPVNKSLTPAFYAACDACLIPLANIPVFQETIPSKIFEVMACERPVIASLDGEGRRIVESSGGGLVARPGDPRSIADGMMAMHRMTPEARASMGRSGRAYVLANYDRTVLTDRYLTLLENVVARRASSAANGVD